MTWKELQIITLQKMYAISSDKLVFDDTTGPYLSGMRAAANEGLMLLSTAGRYKLKSVVVEKEDKSEAKRYDLNELANDFFTFANHVFKIKKDGQTPYFNYSYVGGNFFVLPKGVTGKFEVYYNAYPKLISENTPETEEIDLAPDVAVLLPLYMASELYKEDDIVIATQLRNEFEAERARLTEYTKKHKYISEKITSVTGWW
ncbi:MAG: hypothetical protein IJS94_08770 [Clostridia bacterium]|nr:hypothetical protein [Clostridia bacterium]